MAVGIALDDGHDGNTSNKVSYLGDIPSQVFGVDLEPGVIPVT
jgi:hypothetical protein